MTQNYQPVRGTRDIAFAEAEAFVQIQDIARHAAKMAGFSSLFTPVFEFSEVFSRAMGETSDVVGKEMYAFDDRNGQSLTLRPEFTAAVVRAFISNGWQQHVPLKLFSVGPLFRYERPQKGRMRQFHQLNYEYFGVETPHADVEMMSVAYGLLQALDVAGKGAFQLNSLGDAASRTQYRQALVEYFSRYRSELSEDSQVRLEKNPLRILDSKDKNDQKIAADAPLISAHYTPESAAFFAAVQEGLTLAGVPFIHNTAIVRGLDYYSHTVFEYVVDSQHLGAQNTILAGGRYDGLVEQMGGPTMPAIGFAAGIERLELLRKQAELAPVAVVFLPADDTARMHAVALAQQLRAENISSNILFSGNNLGKKLKKADKSGAQLAILMGEQEMQAQQVSIKHLKTGEQHVVAIDALPQAIKGL